LCEEVILDDLGNLKGDFVTLSQTGLRKMQGKKKVLFVKGNKKQNDHKPFRPAARFQTDPPPFAESP